MLNNYDLEMGLTSIGPVAFFVSVGLVALFGWLVTKK